MSWFLGSSRKKKPRRKWVQQATRKRVWDPARWYPLLRVSFVIGAMAILGAGYVLGREALIRKVGRDAAANTTVKVRFVQAPLWMRNSQLQLMAQQMAGIISPDPLDRKTLASAEQWLSANPWIDQVVSVHRIQGGEVDVTARFRTPVALIEADGKFHLIDARSRRLPAVYEYPQVEQLHLIAITGAAESPPDKGQVWRGPDIAAGLKLVRLMTAQPFADQVRAIDVSNFNGRRVPGGPQLLVLTARGGMVRWGRAPGDESVYEPDAQKKLAMLRRVAASANGAIDGGGGVVDVFPDQPMRHAATEQARYSVEQ